MSGIVKKVLAGAVAVTAVCALGACTGGTPSGGSTGASGSSHLQQIIDRKQINVGIIPDSPPFGQQDASGNVTGYDIDVAQKLADALGVKLNLVKTQSTNRNAMLQSNRVDVDIDVFTVTAQRAMQVEFTIPYASISSNIMYKKDKPITGLDNLAGKTIAVARGSSNDTLVTNNFPEATVQRFDTAADAMEAAETGKVDGVMESTVNINNAIAKDSSMAALTLDKPLQPALIAMGILPGDQTWLNYLDTFIRTINASGDLQTLYQKWFHEDLPAVVAMQ
ncbi:MAG: transporter substrate-binding domain-containing protein [Micrococcales bacterium]|nr:transporter substrate-binding domain-containing protein [Micrococcales bacterium]